jgi:secretion/DNA translocation related CpaE-like protein
VNSATHVLLTTDEATSDAVLAAGAAHGVTVDVVASAPDCLARWPDAGRVLVGADAAAGLASLGPKRRGGVFLVGFAPELLGRWSVPLGGQVILLPDGLAALSAVLADDHGSGGPVVSVVGGSGGIGASTLAAGLAVAARRRGMAAALVDVDPLGGGVDLLLGAERTPGWRWPRLVGARGEVTDVRRFLPQVDGLTVVSMGRPAPGQSAEEAPSAESLRAVLGALARHHQVVVLDAGRAPLASARPALASCAATFLVSGTCVRAVAEASAVLRSMELAEPRVVVRTSPGSRVPGDVVGRALGLPVAGALPEDRALVHAAEQGDPPGRAGRGRWTRSVGRLLDLALAGRGPDGER